ncbi:zinc-binding dehydrogenase [Hypoxylon fuscum]|nr:zinc-binding dehydrogenase [Hypoxylon fuscum]
MTSVRKVVISEFSDDVDVLKVVNDVCPPPSAGEVQIAVEYSGFSGADVNMRKGIYPFMKKAPLTPGYCLVGRITTSAQGSNAFSPGDMVAVLTKYDAQAELVNQPEKYCVKVPDGVDLQQATALVCDWNTAFGMVMQSAKVTRGQKVFVHGLSGAVGYAAMKLCQLQGAEVYGTASERNHDGLRSQGAHPFVYTNKDWIKTMQDIGGAHAVFDPLGFESFDESWSILTSDGIVVGFGTNKNSLGDGQSRNPMLSITKLVVRGYSPFCNKQSTFYALSRDSPTCSGNIETLLKMLKAGEIVVPIKNVWDLENIQAAHREWGSGKGVGSMLIKVAKD